MRIETVLSPLLFHQVENLENKAVVVIDVLRATSTICSILANGANSVITVRTEDEAKMYQERGFLVGGERGGETIPGFHFGNSPFHYTNELVEGKDVVLTTTNGTKCVDMSRNSAVLLIGSFLNLTATVEKLKSENKDVVLFCAGWQDKANLEDTLLAGAIATMLESETDDATLVAKQAWQQSDNLFETLKKSSHFQRLAKKGVEKDILYCCEIDMLNVVPSYDGNAIKL